MGASNQESASIVFPIALLSTFCALQFALYRDICPVFLQDKPNLQKLQKRGRRSESNKMDAPLYSIVTCTPIPSRAMLFCMINKRLVAATYGHLSIDMINASVAMILVAVSDQFDLSVSKIGFAALLYQISSAMSQPLFGSITDRLRGRWVGALGLLWTLLWYSAAVLMPTYPMFMTALMVGGLGSGAFHAAGLLNATVSGGERPTTATSVFFVGGQSGYAIGPILAGLILAHYSLSAMVWVAVAMLPAVVCMILFMNDPLPIEVHHPAPVTVSDSAKRGAKQGAALLIITGFILLITFRSGTSQTFSTFLPKYYDQLGISSARYGFMLGLFAFAGAIGTFLGGYLGDRYNPRWLVFWVMLIGAPFCFLMLVSSGWVFAVAAVMGGILLSVPHSIVLVGAQQLAPKRRGLVGGLVLGYMFAAGSLVAWFASIAADSVGLAQVLMVVAWLPVLGAFTALLLPLGRTGSQSEGLPAPAALLAPEAEYEAAQVISSSAAD